ncbi:PBSX family phage terminase large subunit [Spiroplasma endosymbiont of Seladonia tumulorum]|uniref:PBSX family phage terminase large subunit n=1 Tax=Spiroplasma endosymbiont of Seladonia tumulorum TaxID=3066321 RepID=UPI0030D1D511
MATFKTISGKTKEFLRQKADKLSNKRAYLYYLRLPFNDWEDKVDTKSADFIKDMINKLEIELELILLNDQYGGGKKIYVEKYVKDTNINNANIVVNFDNVDLPKIKEVIKAMNINYKINLSEHSFTLDNGTYIICKGLHSATKREKLKAFADLGKYEFAIEWREEADQLTKEDISELTFAVRGAKRKFVIKSSNPESLGRYIIKYCNEIMPFDEQLMRLKYDQVGKFKINYYEKNKKFTKTVIIHYSSWRLNTYLDDDVIRNQLELEKLDPIRSRVWSWGLPGQLKGAVFARYLKFTKLTWSFDKFTGWCWLCTSR